MKRAVGLADLPTLVRDTAFAAPVITNSFRHSLFALGDGGFMTEGWAADWLLLSVGLLDAISLTRYHLWREMNAVKRPGVTTIHAAPIFQS